MPAMTKVLKSREEANNNSIREVNCTSNHDEDGIHETIHDTNSRACNTKVFAKFRQLTNRWLVEERTNAETRSSESSACGW